MKNAVTTASSDATPAFADATNPYSHIRLHDAALPPDDALPLPKRKKGHGRVLNGTKSRALYADAKIPGNDDRRLVPVQVVMRMFDVSRPTVDRMEKDGEIPPSVYIYNNRKWVLEELTASFERFVKANRGRRGPEGNSAPSPIVGPDSNGSPSAAVAD